MTKKKNPISVPEAYRLIERGFLDPGDLAALMRRDRVTIADLASRMDVSRTRVREVRNRGVSGAIFVRDWLEGVTGIRLVRPTPEPSAFLRALRHDSYTGGLGRVEKETL